MFEFSLCTYTDTHIFLFKDTMNGLENDKERDARVEMVCMVNSLYFIFHPKSIAIG